MTESLFRLLLIRPPVAQDPDTPSIKLTQGTQYQKDLAAALAGNDPIANSAKVSKAYIAGDDFIKDLSGSQLLKSLRRLGVVLDEAGSDRELAVGLILQLVSQIFGVSAASLISQTDFISLHVKLRDSITAVKFSQESHSLPLEELVGLLRDVELIEKAVQLSKKSADTQTHVQVAALEAASSPTTSPEQSLVPEWHVQTVYKVGDQATFKGVTYVCIQAHTSVTGWEPPKTPALWVRVNDDDSPDPKPPGGSDNLFAYRKRSILLPSFEAFKSVISGKPGDDIPGQDDSDTEGTAKNLLEHHSKVLTAIKELNAIDPAHILTTEREPHNGVDIDPKFSVSKDFGEQLQHAGLLRSVNIDQFRAAADRSGTNAPAEHPRASVASSSDGPPPAALADAPATDPLTLLDVAGSSSAVALARTLMVSPQGFKGLTAFNPNAPGAVAPKLRTGTTLSADTMAVLSTLKLAYDAVPLPDMVKTLRASLSDTERSLHVLAPSFEQTQFSMIAGQAVVTKVPLPSEFSKFVTGIDFSRFSPVLPHLPPPDPRIPHTKGQLKSIGVGDLIIVKQQLIGYEGADIAHIENVLKGESMKREHTTTDRRETILSTEEELTTEDSHDLESTSRYEMSQEASKEIKEQFDIKGSAQVTAKYGPAVEFTAKAEGGYQRSKAAASKTASKFSQDVTEKAAKKITERTLKKQTVTTSSEVVETNTHGIDNASGSTNVSGVYQWVNKVYEAQMFNYGLRALFDFMIPEPGAFLTNMMTTAAAQAPSLTKPLPFPLKPSGITEGNYGYWVKSYEATDVNPPPPDYITVSDGLSKGDLGLGRNVYHTASIAIDKNYEAVHARIGLSYNFWKSDAVADVIVGNDTVRLTYANVTTMSLARQRNSIPWGVRSIDIADLVVTVEITCVATEDATNEWKADTHAKLVTAYKARLQEYENKLANLQLQAGVVIQGQNPAANAISIKQELKKNCISIITGQHYDAFNSILNSAGYGPYMNLFEAEAEGEYVRFFEQAFEWENIMYVMYPYFWGRKNTWAQKLAIEDPDPAFDEFLKAGFCRVQVPARPGFEAAIDHFMQFGELWNGGPLPAISSPLFLPIADEIAERAQKPGDEIVQGDPWKVTLPTTLVKLRQDDKLPKWKKDSTGRWIPDET